MNDRLYRSVDDRIIAGVAGGLAERLGVDPAIVRIIWALLVIASGGAFLLLYIVMAIVVPEEEELGSFAPIAPGAAGPTPGPAGAASPGAAPGQPGQPAPAAPTGWVPRQGWAQQGGLTASQARAQARAERRAARAARRAQEGPGRGGVIVGVVLVLLGTWFLIREYIPAIDLDKVWPLLLLVLGVVLVVYSFGVGRGPTGGAGTGVGGGASGASGPGGPTTPGGAA